MMRRRDYSPWELDSRSRIRLMSSSESSSSSDEEENNTFVACVLIESDYTGGIIGRQGTNIRRIKSSSDANINISDEPAFNPSDTLFTVSGTLSSVEKAFSLLIATFSDSPTFKLIAHNNQCGHIIGRGGRMIKNIIDSTDASIFVSPDVMTNSNQRKVIISGNEISITACIIKVLRILERHPATESATVTQDQAQSSQAQERPAGGFHFEPHGSSVRITGFTGFNVASTSRSIPSNTSNCMDATPSSSNLGMEASCIVDCNKFGQHVTSELKKMDSSHQSMLRKEILASIEKIQKAQHEHRMNRIPEECTICLEKVTDKAFATECFHIFCYGCIQRWVAKRTTCPMCVRPITSIYHNIRSNDDYDIELVDSRESMDDSDDSDDW